MTHPLADKILALRGKKSFGLIARKLGVSRNIVAGVMFRAAWPVGTRVPSPGYRYGGNKSGTGHHGGGRYARELLPTAAPGGARA